ncbi:MAG: Fe-S cluster assembly protein SufD [Flavobacteriales bacterium]|nr:MAG: Fe-S cluster assembly protein SufD [Flavobacteriales bacterium]
MDMFKDKLLSSFIVFENQLNGGKNTPFHQQRRKAIDVFEEKGFPTVKNEEWKYTNLKPIFNKDYNVFLSSEESLEFRDVRRFFLSESDTYKIVFINGFFASWLSSTTHQNYDVCTFSAALERHRDIIDKYAGSIGRNEDNFTALNTSFAREGAFIHVPDGRAVEKPIEIIFLTTNNENNTFSQPRNLVVVGRNASCCVVERHQSLGEQASVSNSVTEIFADEGAQVTYHKIQNDGENASLIDSTTVKQKKDSTVTIHTFSFGGKVTRNNLEFDLEEPGATANLYGISILNNRQLVDNHTVVNHIAPHCQSNELYKGIYDDNARGVFNGKVHVYPHAQKTNAFQENNNLLLADTASVDTKPQLEIYADDVKCSHGCTIGQLDEDALFYLRQRGIPFKEAQALLMFAFTTDALQNLGIPELKNKLNRLIARKLSVSLDFDL